MQTPNPQSSTYPQECVQRPVLHVLSDDHYGISLGDDALQVNDVRVVKLTHNGRLSEKVKSRLLRSGRLQCFDCHCHLRSTGNFELSTAYIAKFT